MAKKLLIDMGWNWTTNVISIVINKEETMSDIKGLIKSGALCKECGKLINVNDIKGPGYERLCKQCKEKSLT